MANPMSLKERFHSLIQIVREKFLALNLYNTKSSDPTVVQREILSTRLFILLLVVSIVILTGYTLFSEQNRTDTIKHPSLSVYRNLEKNYPETLQCSCEKVSINYQNFLNMNPSFHQVCSSEFVSQRWIDYVFVMDGSSLWPIDIRRSFSSIWQLMKIFCQTGRTSTISAIDQFINTPLISSIVLSEQLLEANIESAFDQILQTVSSALMRPLITLQRITEANEFVTASSVNYIAVTSAFNEMIIPIVVDDFDVTVTTVYNKYIFNGTTSYCSCRYNGSCPMLANLYLYEIWEQYGVYDFNTIQSNATLPGIIIDCLPIQTILASTLECFYQQSCLNQIIKAYGKAIDISILDQSSSSLYSPTTPIEILIEKLFIEKIEKQTLYDQYYFQCAPTQCTYSYSRRFDITYVITTLLTLFGGLTAAFRLMTPFIIDFILFIKRRQTTGNEPQPQQSENQSIRMRLTNLFERVKTIIVELNLFNTHSHDQLRVRRERITTWLFIILLLITLCILTLYTGLATFTIVKTVQSPTQEQYEYLFEEYPLTLQCPCTVISIPYEDFVQITPTYHQLCHSDFVQPWWYQSLVHENMFDYMRQFSPIVSSHFRTLASFCEIANITVVEATRQFISRIYVNAYVLPRKSFVSQVNASIITFQEMARLEFLYTMSIIGSLMEGNQYISNRMGSTTLFKDHYPELTQFNLSSVRFTSYSRTRINEDRTFCICAFDSKCNVELIIRGEDFELDLFSDLEGMYYGCFITESALKSALLCWYRSSCIENLKNNLEEGESPVYYNITPLDPRLPSRFALNDSTQIIFDELMIEQWHSSILYDKFYQKCQPSYCTYSYKENSNIILIITTVIGFIGGLNVALRLISPLIVKIFLQIKNRRQTTRQQAWTDEGNVSQNPSSTVPPSNITTRLRRKCVELNLFDSESNEEQTVEQERYSTRVYLFLLPICIVSIAIGLIVEKQTTTISISSPNQSEYEALVKSHSYTLQCPCSRVSIPHETFMTINATFHQVCSSAFVKVGWQAYLFFWEDWNVYERADLRGRGGAYFSFLRSLCELSQRTVSNIVTQFLTDTFVGGEVLPQSEFCPQINTLTQRFRTITPEQFSQTLIVMNEMAQASGFVSSYFLNWDWWMEFDSSIVTIPIFPIISNGGCSCGTQNNCTQPGGIYQSLSTIEYLTIPGWNIGCSTADTILRSTLECFYNQSCLDILMHYMTIVEEVYLFTWNMSALETNVTSRFQLNTVIREILEKLFVEQWHVDVSYERFYQQCAPVYCSYTIQESNNANFIFARILGLYGGLTVALRLFIPLFIQIAIKIRHRCCRNTIRPYA